MTEFNEARLKRKLYENIDTNSSIFGNFINTAFDWSKNYVERKAEEIKSRASDYVSGFFGFGNYKNLSQSEKYNIVRDYVKRTLDGEDFGDEVYEIPFAELEKEDAWGMNYSNKIFLPRLKDIPKLLGSAYRYLFNRSKDYESEEEFSQNVQDYIGLHEKLENILQVNSENAEEHAQFEGMLGIALKELAAEKNEKADDVYRGMLAAYWKRFDVGDWFAEKVNNKYFEIKEDVKKYFKTGADALDLVKPAYVYS